jgi:tetratricopeptide (TPR) repeat protein
VLFRSEFDSCYDVLKSDVRYDVVIVGNGVENMQSPIEELKLLSQVMTPDGKAFFSFSNLQFYSVFTSIAYGLYGAGIAVNGRAGSSGSGRMYTRDYAVSLLEKASFRVTTIVELLDPMYQQQIVKESAKSMSLGKMVLDLEGLDAEQAKPFFAVTYFVHAVNNNTVNAITKDMKLAVAPSTVKAKSIEDDGRKLLDCGDYKGAALKFLELIEILPDNADGYTLLGLSEWYKGNIDDAYFLFKHALSITPDDCDALLNFWDAALKTNKVSEAKKILEDALARNPAFTELRDALAKKN